MLPFAAKNGTLEKHNVQCKDQKLEGLHLFMLLLFHTARIFLHAKMLELI